MQVQSLLALAWCKAGADDARNKDSDGDDRKMAQWTLQVRFCRYRRVRIQGDQGRGGLGYRITV